MDQDLQLGKRLSESERQRESSLFDFVTKVPLSMRSVRGAPKVRMPRPLEASPPLTTPTPSDTPGSSPVSRINSASTVLELSDSEPYEAMPGDHAAVSSSEGEEVHTVDTRPCVILSSESEPSSADSLQWTAEDAAGALCLLSSGVSEVAEVDYGDSDMAVLEDLDDVKEDEGDNLILPLESNTSSPVPDEVESVQASSGPGSGRKPPSRRGKRLPRTHRLHRKTFNARHNSRW